MQELTMKNLTQSFVQHYPHLTNFTLGSFVKDNDRNPHVHAFVRLNPQLRSFHTTMRKNASYIAFLNDMLPNLESLGIEIFLSNDVVPIESGTRFKNVKEFTLKLRFFGEHYRAIGNISFDRLETFILDDAFFSTGVKEDVIELILNNRNLRAFKASQCLTNEQTLRLVNALPELEEISLDWASKKPVLLTSIFNAKHPKLNRIDVSYFYDSAGIDWLTNIIPPAWQVEVNEGIGTSFSLISKN